MTSPTTERSRARRPALIGIPAGAWTVGSPEPGPTERPQRRVRLAAFRVDPAPVTNAEYRCFLRATGHAPPPFEDDDRLAEDAQPVVGVSWHDAVAYLAWLAATTGLPVRLPSEDEREVAARGGLSGCAWPWGPEPPDLRPELRAIAALGRPHAPGPDCANAYGLSCMADNVHEWCSDLLEAAAGSERRAGDGPARRVSRGGSFRHRVPFTPVAARSSLPPDRRYADYGFRVFADAADRAVGREQA